MFPWLALLGISLLVAGRFLDRKIRRDEDRRLRRLYEEWINRPKPQ
ncbi:MAG: hypothetical protein M1598_09820 [Actinobacteria bacterium]|nr:hypothetical protein [Actinomycetota bacterium]